MYYKRRRERVSSEDGDQGFRNGKRKLGGGRFTALSFMVVGVCLLFVKLTNPGAPMRAPVAMVVSVGLACVLMSYIARRMR
jgi:hypothetical protein